MLRRYMRPANAVWAALAIPLFLLALIVVSLDVVAPFEWDGRPYEPHPWRAALEFLPAAVGFVAFTVGAGRPRRTRYVWAWASATTLWAAILALEPA